MTGLVVAVCQCSASRKDFVTYLKKPKNFEDHWNPLSNCLLLLAFTMLACSTLPTLLGRMTHSHQARPCSDARPAPSLKYLP